MAGANDAAGIAQASLDATGAALLAGDFAAFAHHFLLPATVATPDGARHLRDTADLRRTFDEVAEYYRSNGVTQLQRTVLTALFDGPDLIRHSHETRMSAGDRLVRPPHQAHSLLRRIDGAWRVSESITGVSGSDSARDALLGTNEAPPVGAPEVLAIVQGNVDTITHAYLDRDFDALAGAITLPLFKQGLRGAEVFTDLPMLHADFERYLAQMTMHGITDLVRVVKSAQMVGETRIHASHRTHVLARTRLLMPSYPSAITLEQGADHIWRLTSIMHPTDRPTLDRIAADVSA